MKRIMSFFLLFAMCCYACTSYAFNTMEDIEKELGIDLNSADAKTLKAVIIGYDEALTGYYQLIDKCLTLLVNLGETEWVNSYLGEPIEKFGSMSITQLIILKNEINLAIWNNQDWQEVTVPQGVWKVGEDIPAGHWTVKCAPGASYSNIDWGERVSESGDSISWSGRYSVYNKIYNPSKYGNADEYVYEYSFAVVNGDYIKISNGSAVFMPYVGKPSLGFK